jgi:NADPH-dependent 2,4-dienoyl-CoA reductase/sulfur reductase-like enzyme
MKKIELAIIGAGPAGIAAATTAAKFGVQTTLIDEYVRPGGQLIKQTHKFFGSEAHKAGIRGIDIARQFCSELEASNVELMMGTTVWSIFDSKILSVCHGGITEQIRAEKPIIATGVPKMLFHSPAGHCLE